MREVIEPGSVIVTDGWGSYNELPTHGYIRTKLVLSDFNRRNSKNRGLLFRRLIKQAVSTDPVTETDRTSGDAWR